MEKFKIIKDKESGYWVRAGKYTEQDIYVIKETKAYMKFLDVENKVVLDIGAHYGGFSSLCDTMGAKTVIAVEPVPFNFKLLQKNAPNAIKLNGALVCSKHKGKKVTLYRPNNYTATGTTAKVPRNPVDTMEVFAIDFKKLLAAHRPSVIKMDCEGCEYDLLLNTKIPNYVKQIIIEFHLNVKAFKEQVDEAAALFDGWEVVKPMKTNWRVHVACWRRK